MRILPLDMSPDTTYGHIIRGAGCAPPVAAVVTCFCIFFIFYFVHRPSPLL